jgi:hypothetical protein
MQECGIITSLRERLTGNIKVSFNFQFRVFLNSCLDFNTSYVVRAKIGDFIFAQWPVFFELFDTYPNLRTFEKLEKIPTHSLKYFEKKRD